jgi:hypothetical protein
MQRTQLFAAPLVVAALVALGGCCSPGLIGNLPVTLHPQETSMWCWAGSGEMVMDYLGNDVAQCTQANNRFGRNDCPCNQCGASPVPSPPCVNGGWPEFDKYGFTFERTSDAALSWDHLRADLSQQSKCRRTPVAFSWHWNGNGGHMMVVTGYVTLEGTNYVSILDPWAPCVGDASIIPYTEYVSGGGYTHWDDFHHIRRQ